MYVCTVLFPRQECPEAAMGLAVGAWQLCGPTLFRGRRVRRESASNVNGRGAATATTFTQRGHEAPAASTDYIGPRICAPFHHH